jgi:hypothetical protein
MARTRGVEREPRRVALDARREQRGEEDREQPEEAKQQDGVVRAEPRAQRRVQRESGEGGGDVERHLATGREGIEARERGHRQVLESGICARLRTSRISDASGERSRFRSRGATPVRGPPLEPALVICRGAAAASPWERRFPMTVRSTQGILHSSLARSGVLSTMLSSASADDNGGGGEGKSGKQTSSGRIRRGAVSGLPS